jgi:hypothetical protein
MDHTAITYKAVVDWVEFEIQTGKPTNSWTVRAQLGEILKLPADVKTHVTPMDKGDGGSATVFRFRVQDVARFQIVEKALRGLTDRFGIVRHQITAIEVALDVYGGNGPRIVADLYRFNTLNIGKNHRIYCKAENIAQALPSRMRSLVDRISDGWQIKISDHERRNDVDCDIVQHLYWKTTDNGGKTTLDAKDCRARIEVTLRHDALPFRTLDELKAFRFESIANRYFQFVEFKCDAEFKINKYVIAAIRNPTQVRKFSERRSRKRRINGEIVGGGNTVRSRCMQADSVLTSKARYALRNLSGRWCGGPRQKRTISAQRAPHYDIQIRANSGDLSLRNPDVSRESRPNSNNYYITPIPETTTQDVSHDRQQEGSVNEAEGREHAHPTQDLALIRLPYGAISFAQQRRRQHRALMINTFVLRTHFINHRQRNRHERTVFIRHKNAVEIRSACVSWAE